MSEEKRNSENIKELAAELEFSLCGIADIQEIRAEFNLKKETAEKFPYAISLAKQLLNSVLEDIEDSPTPLYFHHYKQINYFLDRRALRMASYLQAKGFEALPIAASQIIDWEKQEAHVSHKKVANLAGLGWIGRNNLLVNPELGARHRLVTVLTDLPLKPDKQLIRDCIVCRRCLAPCPAEAIKERVEDFDHMACYEKLKEFRKQGLVGQNICGVCVKACWGKVKRK